MSLKEMQDPPVISPEGPTGRTGRTRIAKSSSEGRPPDRPPRWLVVTRWLAIGLTLLVLAIVVQKLIEQGAWIGVIIAAFVAMCILVIYGTGRSVPMKYLLPGMLLLVGLQIWPIAYTVATSFTNYGDGHLETKQQSIEAIIANSVREVPNTSRYLLSVAVKEGSDPATGKPYYLLTDPAGKTRVGDKAGLTDLPAAEVEKAGNGRIVKASGYQILTAIQVNGR
jgi:arabinogalactan oligomer/maltooligosaccharide transport system permease protein